MSSTKISLQLQPLETREVPATLLGPTRMSYQDVDGDTVTVAFSKPILTPANVNTIFTFNSGSVNGNNTTQQQLQSINLTGITAAAKTTITTSAVRSPINGGDGFAALGQIAASDIDLGSITIDGDLGRILAGDATLTTPGLGALSVHSIGRFGTSTGAASLESVINGSIGALRVKTDVKDAFIRTNGTNGNIGSITIGGSLIGGAASDSGIILATGNIGPIRVTGDLQGGTGQGTALIISQANIASVSIGGSLIGNGPSSAGVSAGVNLGPVTIRGDVIGGSGLASGGIQAGQLKQLTIGGSLIGGTGNNSGFVITQMSIGSVNIVGDIVGSSGELSGNISTAGKLASATVGGSLIGNSGKASGQIRTFADMGPITIRGNVQGGTFNATANTDAAGAIISGAKLTSVTIGGSLIGGTSENSGLIFAQNDINLARITGRVQGGSGLISGAIHSEGRLVNASIGGSLLGGSGIGSGIVLAEQVLTLSIAGDIRGGSASGIADLQFSGVVYTGRIGTMTLGGSLIAGVDDTAGQFANNGAIRVVDDIANLTIRGNILGNTTNQALITARGQKNPTGTTDVAIGRLTVGGRVERGLIYAGVDGEIPTPTAVNADAQIGTVSIAGDWIASSLVAGIVAGVDGNFGSGDDAKMSGIGVKDEPTVSSRINSLSIGGQAYGTFGGSDRYGIVANIIGTLRVGGTNIPFLLANTNENVSLGITGDLSVVEVIN